MIDAKPNILDASLDESLSKSQSKVTEKLIEQMKKALKEKRNIPDKIDMKKIKRNPDMDVKSGGSSFGKNMPIVAQNSEDPIVIDILTNSIIPDKELDCVGCDKQQ